MTEPTAAPPRALLVYATTHGHTAKIAVRMAAAMREHGVDVDLRNVDDASAAEPSEYDVVVVGGSLHKEGHQHALVAWVTARRDALNRCASVFFSVSLSAAEDTDEAVAATQRCIDAFRDETGWNPARTERIAGCLQYREYDFFTRQLMRLMMKGMGHPTDASRDYDYTDWDAVDRLGGEIAANASAPAVVSSAEAPLPA